MTDEPWRILDDEIVGQWLEDCMAGRSGDYLLIYESHKALREQLEAVEAQRDSALKSFGAAMEDYEAATEQRSEAQERTTFWWKATEGYIVEVEAAQEREKAPVEALEVLIAAIENDVGYKFDAAWAHRTLRASTEAARQALAQHQERSKDG